MWCRCKELELEFSRPVVWENVGFSTPPTGVSAQLHLPVIYCGQYVRDRETERDREIDRQSVSQSFSASDLGGNREDAELFFLGPRES